MSTRIPSFLVTSHLDHIQSRGTFVALPAALAANKQLVQEAITRGATTIIFQKDAADSYNRLCDSDLQEGVRYVLVSNARRALASRSAAALGYPAEKMTLIGVSGNERKKTSELLCKMLLDAGHQVACLEAQRRDGTPSGDFIQQFLAQSHVQSMTHVIVDTGDDRQVLDDLDTIAFSHVVVTDHNATQSTVLHARQLFAQSGMHTVVHAQHSSLLDYIMDELPLATHVVHQYDTDRFFERGLAYKVEVHGLQCAVRVYDEHDSVSLLAAAVAPDVVMPLLLAASVARQCGAVWAHVAHAMHHTTVA